MEFRRKQKNDRPLTPTGLMIETARKKLRGRALLVTLVGLVLVVALAAIGFAWYTRTVNTYSVTFDVAEYDLSVNQNTDNDFLLDIYRYTTVQNDKFAPGMFGYMPMNIAIYHSDTDVPYTIGVDSKIADVMKDHIGLFYLEEKVGPNDTDWAIYYGDALENANLLNPNLKNPDVNEFKLGDKTLRRHFLIGENKTISDVLRVAEGEQRSKKLCLYWNWFLDKQDAVYAGATQWDTVQKLENESDADYAARQRAHQQEEIDRWDAQDTDVGRYPNKYKDAFFVILKTSGTQVNPDEKTATRPGSPTEP